MARKTCSEEFRRQAVELYESTPGATFRGIAADLGITRNTLKDWVTSRGRASTASARAGTNATTPRSAAGTAGSPRHAPPRRGSPQAELAALRARVAALESQHRLRATQRDILRQAAKYSAGETRWSAASSSSLITGTPSR